MFSIYDYYLNSSCNHSGQRERRRLTANALFDHHVNYPCKAWLGLSEEHILRAPISKIDGDDISYILYPHIKFDRWNCPLLLTQRSWFVIFSSIAKTFDMRSVTYMQRFTADTLWNETKDGIITTKILHHGNFACGWWTKKCFRTLFHRLHNCQHAHGKIVWKRRKIL